MFHKFLQLNLWSFFMITAITKQTYLKILKMVWACISPKLNLQCINLKLIHCYQPIKLCG